jgi:hypothetical protein
MQPGDKFWIRFWKIPATTVVIFTALVVHHDDIDTVIKRGSEIEKLSAQVAEIQTKLAEPKTQQPPFPLFVPHLGN